MYYIGCVVVRIKRSALARDAKSPAEIGCVLHRLGSLKKSKKCQVTRRINVAVHIIEHLAGHIKNIPVSWNAVVPWDAQSPLGPSIRI